MTIQTGENIEAGDFINESEADATPANDKGKAVKLESDGKLSGFFLRTPSIKVFTSSGTWNKPAGLRYVVVEVQGGGAGGTTSGSGGAGGGAGGYAKKTILADDLSATETVTVGASAGANTNGNNSSFGAHVTANGGGQPTGGTASGGDFSIPGQDGTPGLNDIDGLNISGKGGDSVLGFGGVSVNHGESSGGTTSGNAGKGYGAGGSGGAGGSSSSGTGGTGSQGVVIVTEYF